MTTIRDKHDVLLVDLDGTLYRGQHAVPGAADAIRAAADAGARSLYITNNASRSPDDVAHHLVELGFPATADDVATSAQAAAAILKEKVPAGSVVLVVGTEALVDEVKAVGLVPTDKAEGAVAVVQGHNTKTGWAQLAEATIALRNGAVWVASNGDATLPTERGPLPGNGAMVAAVSAATGLKPKVAGKPEPTLLQEAAHRANAKAPIVIGDRIDTDIQGGRAAGYPTLLVLTGVAQPKDVIGAIPEQRPTYVAHDLDALSADIEDLTIARAGEWKVENVGSEILLRGSGSPIDALRTLCAVHWDGGGGPVDGIAAEGHEANEALVALGLKEAGPQ